MINKEKIFNALEGQRKRAGLTFADVDRIFEENHFDYKGPIWLENDLNKNVIYWSGWNRTAFDLFQEYMLKFNLKILPTSLFIYLISGKALRLPTVHTKSLKAFKKIHKTRWLPVKIITAKEFDEV